MKYCVQFHNSKEEPNLPINSRIYSFETWPVWQSN
jgi:hypothetical protein